LLLIALLAAPTISSAHAQTVVSLTFDDGIATQMTAKSLLAKYGMNGTFFIVDGWVGTDPYFMNWSQVDSLAAAGNEIGGHTVDHPFLAGLTYAQQQHEICDDAATLRARGYLVTTFAYPHGSGVSYPDVRSLITQCGFHAARAVGGLYGPLCTEWCDFAERIPPRDMLGIESNEYITGPLSLSLLETYVTQAEDSGGGWVPLMFHDICDACADSSVSAADLDAFLAWLKARAPLGTMVKTMHDVIDGPAPDTIAPTTSVTCNAAACATSWYRQAVSVALAATDVGGSGVAATRYTTDGTTPTSSSPVYSAPLVLSQSSTLKYRSWDAAGNAEPTRTLTLKIDTAAPTVVITAPADGATIKAAQYTITASATDVGSGTKTVEFFADGKRLGTDGLAPFSWGWKASKGVHKLTAAATDVAGNTGTSAPVTITAK
jgi:peptidoglycan/xylan/chitin deacetylase (PgdA/CDA1 family)